MSEGRSSFGPSQGKLFLGLGVMAAIIFAQGALGVSVATRADAEARMTFNASLASVREVSRLAHAVDEDRVLISEHILDNDTSAVRTIETRLSETEADVERAMQRHAQLVLTKQEGQLWKQVQTLEARFERCIRDALDLSRRSAPAAARARLAEGQKDHLDLDSKLVELMQLNLDRAGQAMGEVRSLQRRAEVLQWGTTLAGLCLLLLFGTWGTRRIVRYERKIMNDAREIEERNRDLDAFAGRVAHDLRNALGPIVLVTPSIAHGSPDPTRAQKIAERIDRCTDRALSVVDALLAFSRAGHNAAAEERGALRTTLGSVREELACQIGRLGVSFEVGEVPDVELLCTSGLLHVVLANVCGNAVKYLEGRQERRVRVSAHEEGSLCRIEVADTGPGIAKDLHQRIFEPFFRVEGTAVRGTGIGLATVRRIVEARRGRIEVESELGRGARFTIWLPIFPCREPSERGDGASGSRNSDGKGSDGRCKDNYVY